MKFIIRILSFFALLCSFAACSNGHGTVTNADPFAEGDEDNPSSSTSKGDSSVVKRDTTFAPEEVLYYSSAVVFCWTDGCEAEFAPSSSGAESPTGKSSSSNGGSTAKSSSSKAKSSSSAVKPVVDESAMTMLDKRTNIKYNLKNINGILWTTTNLVYGTTSGNGVYCANNDKGENVCGKYGTFFDYETAQEACPSGWRLPTKAEAEAALEIETDKSWEWVLTGRFVIENGKATYSKEGEEGRVWVDDYSENTIQLGKTFKQLMNATDRGQNVRCVAKATKTPTTESSSSAKSSSSSAKSSSSEVEPKVDDKEENLTDNRTGKTYTLRKVDNGPGTTKILWMTTNLITETEDGNGIYCDNNGENICSTHGTFFDKDAAQNACPSGWRLPTADEATIATTKIKSDAKNPWEWPLDGRFEISQAGASYGQSGDQGRLWLEGGSALQITNYGTIAFSILGANDTDNRAFNIRCVKESTAAAGGPGG